MVTEQWFRRLSSRWVLKMSVKLRVRRGEVKQNENMYETVRTVFIVIKQTIFVHITQVPNRSQLVLAETGLDEHVESFLSGQEATLGSTSFEAL